MSDGCAALTGYAAAELMGNGSVSVGDLIHEDDLAQVVSQVNEALAAGRPFQVTYRIRSKRGAVRWVWERGRGVGGDGAPLIEGLALDVTAVYEHEDRLLHLEPTDPREVVSETGALLRRVLSEDVELRLRLDDGVGPARAARSAVRQILLNLVLNARDAMPQGGILDIALAPGERSACLTVTDTGIGMEPAVQARVFDPFFTTKPAGRGSGLGLAVVHALVRRHRGTVHLTSAPAAGATVRIAFPLAEEMPRPAPSAGAIGVGTPTALVVEDDPALRDAARLPRAPRVSGGERCRRRGRPGARAVLLQKPWTMPELAGALHRAMGGGRP